MLLFSVKEKGEERSLLKKKEKKGERNEGNLKKRFLVLYKLKAKVHKRARVFAKTGTHNHKVVERGLAMENPGETNESISPKDLIYAGNEKD